MRRYVVAALIAVIVTLALFAAAGKKNAPTAGVLEAAPAPERVMVDGVSGGTSERAATPRDRSGWAPQIARSGKLSLFVDDPQKAADAIASIARRYGGQILSLELASGGGSAPPNAQMQIRVPADRYESAVAAVAATGKVRDRSETAQDLTGDIADSTARLENLRRTENDMRKIMDRSGDVAQILDVENQLSQVREQIQTLESDMKTMHNQVTYSTIDIALQTQAGAVMVDAAPAYQLAAAWQSAVRALVQTTVTLASAVVWLAVFAPYALIVAAIAAVVLRRRARA